MFRRACFLLLLITCNGSFAQSVFKKNTDLQDYLYKKEASGGLRVQTNGIALYLEYGWIKDLKRTRLLQVEYFYHINYQQKIQKAQRQSGRSFYYGMQNKFHAIRISYGFKHTIADKGNRNGVRLSVSFFGGFSLGLAKPYYLNLLQPTTDGDIVIKPERYNSDNASRFLSLDSIVEAAPIRYGLNQMQPMPGVHLKSSLDFDWGTKDAFVKALEAGIMLDLYYKRIPVMVNKSNRFYQIGLYVAFHFGKRW
jgi:hypothetical protein